MAIKPPPRATTPHARRAPLERGAPKTSEAPTADKTKAADAAQAQPAQGQTAAQFEGAAPAAAPATVAPEAATAPVAGTSFRQVGLRAQADAGQAPAPLSAKERLLALVKPPVASADAPPAPSARALKRKVQEAVGHHARRMSPQEIASAIGEPAWASAIADLGARSSAPGSAKSPNFLLAAHLAQWMDGHYTGATLDDVVQSFRAAHPEADKVCPHLDASFLAALQKAFAFLPQWTTKPEVEPAATGADAWLAEPTEKDLYAERLENALGQLAEVPLHMELTSGVADKLAEDQRFKGHNVVMVQHMLGQANPFLDAMVAAGLEVDKAEYVGVPYQNNPAVEVTLERKHGIEVTVPERGNIESMWDNVCAAVDRAAARHEENGEPILIIDDGGYASKYICERYPDKAHLFKVVEQTTRGLTEISKIDPKFPILNVAGSFGKRFESAQVGDAVVQTIRNVLDELTTTPARKDVLVVGAGKVGLGVAEAFQGDGSRVSIYDPYLTPARKKELRKKGFRIIDSKEQALNKKFLVVGSSGHRSIDMEDFVKMSSPVFIASSSSKRVEIDMLGLKDQATKDGVLRRILAAKVNEQETWHYWTKDGRIVTAMADGLPVNFQDVNSIAPELIDHTMALMLLGAGEAVLAEGEGLVELDAHEQFRLQVQLEDLSTERRSPDDFEVKLGDTSYFGTRDQWVEIANSAATPPEVLHGIYAEMVDTDPMHPLALAAVGANHELSDATVEDVLARGNLAHVVRLLNNEYLGDEQQDDVIEFLWGAYEDIAGFGKKSQGFGERVSAPVQKPDGSHYWVQPRGVMHDTVIVHTSNDRDVMLAQLSAALFAHPQCPPHLFENALRDPYGYFRFHGDANVGALRLLQNEMWTTDQLREMAPGIVEAAHSALSTSGKQPYSDYGYDLLSVLYEHPSADDETRELAKLNMARVLERANDKHGLPRGPEAWRETPLGIQLPDYS